VSSDVAADTWAVLPNLGAAIWLAVLFAWLFVVTKPS
jgi:hypothetical protein